MERRQGGDPRGPNGDGEFLSPLGVALAPLSGDVYVVDLGNHRVQYFTTAGGFLGAVGRYGSGPGEFNEPVYCAISPDGRRLYVTDSRNLSLIHI